MKKWEYRFEKVSGLGYLKKKIEQCADEGWELFSALPNVEDGSGYLLIFRQ
jgi:hypothetical protein